MRFAESDDIRAVLRELPGPDAAALDAATARNAILTKPPGSLGRLEDLAIWYAGWRGSARPALERPQIVIFAGNHGIAAQGVSAYPAEVTAQMVANFRAGGAAINQLAAAAGARLDVHALALDRPTADFTKGAAMTEAELALHFGQGFDAVDEGADLLIAGEMGIGNTTAAAALALLLFGGTPADWTGRGTGVDDAGLDRKRAVVAAAAARHAGADPLAALAAIGGREAAAMAGAVLRARLLRIPVLLDGFPALVAAAVLERQAPGALDHAIAGHRGAEPGHARLLAELGKEPLVSLGLRLGEGSGAAVALPILKAAVACLSGMATFAEAGVSSA